MDESAFQTGAQGWGHQHIIDTPAHIAGAGAVHLAPPTVMTAALFEFAKSIQEAGFHERSETGALLHGEAVVLHVRFGMREIDLGVRHIQVTAENDGLSPFQFAEEAQENDVPLLAIGQAAEVALGIGDVDVHDKKVLKLRGEHAAFVIVFRDTDVRRDFQWAEAGEDGRAGITLAAGAVPIRGVVRRPKLFDVVRLALGFLQAKNIGLLGLEKFEKVFAQHGAEAIDVPTD